MATAEVCATRLTIWTCTTSRLATAAASHAVSAGFDPLVVHLHADVAQLAEAVRSDRTQWWFKSTRRQRAGSPTGRGTRLRT